MTLHKNVLWELLLADDLDQERIIECINKHPEYCSHSVNKIFLVHIAIERTLSVEIIRQMLDCYPACCMIQDSKGCDTLLNNVLRNTFDSRFSVYYRGMYCPSSEIVLCIINKCPEAVRIVNAIGYLPLHMECRGNCRYDVITKLVEIYPEAVNIKEKQRGSLPLYHAVGNYYSQLDSVLFLLDRFPDAAKIKSIGGGFPLHAECSHKCRSEVIMKLLSIYPEAAYEPGFENYYAIHSILEKSISLDLVIHFINLHREAIREVASEDYEAYLPLHIECNNQCRYDIITLMLNIYPEAVQIGCESDNLPLHFALNPRMKKFVDNESNAVVTLLINAYPGAAKIKNFYDNYPLHIECRHHCRHHIIVRLLELYPEAIKIKSKRYLPLHLVLGSNFSVDTICLLLDKYPAAASIPNKRGYLPFHVMFEKYMWNYHNKHYQDSILCKRNRPKSLYLALVKLFNLYPKAVQLSARNPFIDRECIQQDQVAHRILLNLTSHVLKSNRVSVCHNLNWLYRSVLLYLLLQLSSRHQQHPYINIIVDHTNAVKYKLLLQMVHAASERVEDIMPTTEESSRFHLPEHYNWIKHHDLLRHIIVYL